MSTDGEGRYFEANIEIKKQEQEERGKKEALSGYEGKTFSISAIRDRVDLTDDVRREAELPYQDSDIRYLLSKIDRLRGDLISLANHISITLKDD